jgi:hypothetical protein
MDALAGQYLYLPPEYGSYYDLQVDERLQGVEIPKCWREMMNEKEQ